MMIHIVFNEADIEALSKSFVLDESLRGDIIQVKDEYAVGPIQDIFLATGIENRNNWWREILAGGDYAGAADTGKVDDQKIIAGLRLRLNNNISEVIWIWAAQNKHDVCGYYWLISQLKDFQGRVFILYLNNLPFINEKGHIFYPHWLHTIPPREFPKAKKLARPVTAGEFETDPDEWLRLCNENKGVRILEGGKKLIQFDYDFYDADLRKFITGDWIKAGKLIHQFLSKAPHTTGDAYLLWRLKEIIQSGELDVQGEQKNMKDFEIKSKTLQAGAVS
jgi:hypothetical protein